MKLGQLANKLRHIIEDWDESEHPRAEDGKFGDKEAPASSEPPKAKPASKKMPTYPQAQAAIFSHLTSQKWTVNSKLKIPHATSPDGKLRLWFKPQAVHYTYDPAFRPTHTFGDARTIDYELDIRKLSPEDFVKYIEKVKHRRF